MKYRDLFIKLKPVMAMVHLKGDACDSVQERARREIDIYLNCGVDAVLVENYFGSAGDVGWTLKYLQEHLPDVIYGINVLGDYRRAFDMAGEYGAKYIQIDSVCGHLTAALYCWVVCASSIRECAVAEVSLRMFGWVWSAATPLSSPAKARVW